MRGKMIEKKREVEEAHWWWNIRVKIHELWLGNGSQIALNPVEWLFLESFHPDSQMYPYNKSPLSEKN